MAAASLVTHTVNATHRVALPQHLAALASQATHLYDNANDIQPQETDMKAEKNR